MTGALEIDSAPLLARVTPVGTLPEATEKVAPVGKLVAATLKVLAVPETKVVLLALVNAGASLTVRVKLCVASGELPLEAVTVTV